jgi:hypothetical protein
VPAWEVGGLQLAGQRGHRVRFDSLEDSSPAEDFVHGWPHKLLSRMTRSFNPVLTEQTYSRVTTAWARRVLDRDRRTAGATVVDRTEKQKTLLAALPDAGVKHPTQELAEGSYSKRAVFVRGLGGTLAVLGAATVLALCCAGRRSSPVARSQRRAESHADPAEARWAGPIVALPANRLGAKARSPQRLRYRTVDVHAVGDPLRLGVTVQLVLPFPTSTVSARLVTTIDDSVATSGCLRTASPIMKDDSLIRCLSIRSRMRGTPSRAPYS